MVYTTSAYWQRGENDSALLLQHTRYARTPFVLACVCAAEGEAQAKAGAYLTKQLLQWFQKLPQKRIAKAPGPRLAGLAPGLSAFFQKTDGEIASCGLLPAGDRAQVTGIFCAGPCFLLFHRGSSRIFLMQQNLHGGCVRAIPQKTWGDKTAGSAGEVFLRPGVLQEDVGLLIASQSMVDCIGQEKIGECLDVTQMSGKAQTDRHLRELGRLAQNLGGRHMTAVFLQSGGEEGV